MSAPNMLIPIMVLNVLGAESTANYYITYAIVSILFMIPYAFTTSLFVEGSHGGEMKKSVLFGDFSKYYIRDVMDITLVRLDEVYAEYGQVAFLAFSRHDGVLLDAGTNPIKALQHPAS